MASDIIEQLSVGSRVYCARTCGIAKAEEPGIVYESYTLGGRKGVSIIFENGGYDGFSPEDCAIFILPEGSSCPKASAYHFSNVGQLANDHRAKKFDFSSHRPFAEIERSEIEPSARRPAGSQKKAGL